MSDKKRPKPMIPKAGFTKTRGRRLSKGGSLKTNGNKSSENIEVIYKIYANDYFFGIFITHLICFL